MPSFRGMRQTLRGGAGYASMYGAPATNSDGRKVVSIGGDMDSSGPSVPDTKAARKANSPKAKAKALKAVNKAPLTPDSSPFGSDAGFKMSDAASDYASAKRSESRLTNPTQDPSFKEHDQDTVSAYVATGKSPWSKEGEAHLAPIKAKRKKIQEDYG